MINPRNKPFDIPIREVQEKATTERVNAPIFYKEHAGGEDVQLAEVLNKRAEAYVTALDKLTASKEAVIRAEAEHQRNVYLAKLDGAYNSLMWQVILCFEQKKNISWTYSVPVPESAQDECQKGRFPLAEKAAAMDAFDAVRKELTKKGWDVHIEEKYGLDIYGRAFQSTVFTCGILPLITQAEGDLV